MSDNTREFDQNRETITTFFCLTLKEKVMTNIIVLARVIRAEFVVVEKISTSERGSCGFGHTGRY